MRSDEKIRRLDQLIQALEGSAMVLEHLQAARRYLLGASFGEYRSCLQFGLDSSFSIADRGVREDAKATLAFLLA